MSAIDILGKLNGADSLETLQRILLITDGTLTDILEAAFLERIRLVKIAQQTVPAAASHTRLAADGEETFLERKILLQGEKSGRNYAYAESVIAIDRLGPVFRDELLHSDIPLGRLWLAHKLETYKELQDVRSRPANDLCHYFKCGEASPLLMRTYGVFSATRPVMTISEYFPAA